MISFIAIIGVIACTITGAIGSLFFKLSSEKFSLSYSGILKNRFFFYGSLIYLVSTIIYLSVLSAVELSILYPLVSLQYIWISILSVKYLKEKMNLMKWSGITLIILGATLISVG
ncbi:MAG: EamA family transporter [Candidatus Woesearchaeota archaeon]